MVAASMCDCDTYDYVIYVPLELLENGHLKALLKVSKKSGLSAYFQVNVNFNYIG